MEHQCRAPSHSNRARHIIKWAVASRIRGLREGAGLSQSRPWGKAWSGGIFVECLTSRLGQGWGQATLDSLPSIFSTVRKERESRSREKETSRLKSANLLKSGWNSSLLWRRECHKNAAPSYPDPESSRRLASNLAYDFILRLRLLRTQHTTSCAPIASRIRLSSRA